MDGLMRMRRNLSRGPREAIGAGVGECAPLGLTLPGAFEAEDERAGSLSVLAEGSVPAALRVVVPELVATPFTAAVSWIRLLPCCGTVNVDPAAAGAGEADLFDDARELAAPRARVRLYRGADPGTVLALDGVSDGNGCDCVLGERVRPSANLDDRAVARRSLGKPDNI